MLCRAWIPARDRRKPPNDFSGCEHDEECGGARTEGCCSSLRTAVRNDRQTFIAERTENADCPAGCAPPPDDYMEPATTAVCVEGVCRLQLPDGTSGRVIYAVYAR